MTNFNAFKWLAPTADYCDGKYKPTVEESPFDMFCPYMATAIDNGDNNYWRQRCIERQQDGGGCHNTHCKVGRELSGNAGPVKCSTCGEPAVSKARRLKAGITFEVCQKCLCDVLDSRQMRKEREHLRIIAAAEKERRSDEVKAKKEAARAARNRLKMQKEAERLRARLKELEG